MAQKKKEIIKTKTKEVEKEPELSEESDEIEGPKAKKPIDLEAALEPAIVVDEKSEDEVPVVTDDSEDSSADEISLDDEELNPFGDKWEQ